MFLTVGEDEKLFGFDGEFLKNAQCLVAVLGHFCFHME